jgi:hypothetical protein
MDKVALAVQMVIALGIFNVWLLRLGQPTSWRGGAARSMKEEFAFYGFPGWFMYLVGSLKLSLATLLIAGVWIPSLTVPAAIAMAVLMLGAIAAHVKVKDPVQKSLPAFCMLLLSVFVAAM